MHCRGWAAQEAAQRGGAGSETLLVHLGPAWREALLSPGAFGWLVELAGALQARGAAARGPLAAATRQLLVQLCSVTGTLFSKDGPGDRHAVHFRGRRRQGRSCWPRGQCGGRPDTAVVWRRCGGKGAVLPDDAAGGAGVGDACGGAAAGRGAGRLRRAGAAGGLLQVRAGPGPSRPLRPLLIRGATRQ